MPRCLWLLSCLLALSTFVSCERKLPTAPVPEEIPHITFGEDKIPLANGEFQYEQTICNNNPGQALDYAYCVETLSGKLPAKYLVDDNGWLLFGDDIWTDSATLKLSYESHGGELQDMVKAVKIKTRTPEGQITEISSPFKSTRIISSRIGTNFASGDTVACGLEFNLQEVVGDIFVEGMYAHHFMYRLNMLNASMQVISPGTWHSSMQMADIRRVILNGSTTPALTPTPENQYTQFECYVVSRQGIEEANPQNIIFCATGGFKPQALIFPQTVAGLGSKHYSITRDDPMTEHELIPSGQAHRNRRLWQGADCMEAIWTSDFKLYLRWGYYGQYGVPYNAESVILTNNPWDSEINLCYDATTHENYHSRIDSYDLRWDYAPFPSQSYFVNPHQVVHQDGSTWLRIKNLNDTARHFTFSGLTPGMHQLEVCAVDLQNVASDPAIQSINLVPYKPGSMRSGILIVDDDANHAQSPEIVVDNFYSNVTPGNYGPVDAVNLHNPDQSTNPVSPVMCQNYKCVLWHADNPSANTLLYDNIDALELYLGNEGNMLLSGTNRLTTSFNTMNAEANGFLERLGIHSPGEYGVVSNSPTTNNFFVSAEGIGSVPDIGLEFNDPFSAIVEFRQGLSSVTYFNPGMNVEYLFQFGCKHTDAAVMPPTQEQYDFFSSRYVGYKAVNRNSQVIVMGFPLSYMIMQNVHDSLEGIFSNMLGTQGKQRRGI